MSRYITRPYEGVSDLAAVVELAQRLTASRLPGPTDYHLGDVVWQLYRLDESEDAQLWFDGARVVAFAIFEPPLDFGFEIDTAIDDPRALAGAVIRWAETRRALVPDDAHVPIAYESLGTGTLSTPVFDADAQRIDWLVSHGYEAVQLGGVRYARSLEQAPPLVTLPAGAIVRHATDADVSARAELHRDAWSVWGTSTFTEEVYRHLRAMPFYDPELDIIVEADGLLVSYCVAWADTANGVGYFEPVGTRPSATGRGYGRAAMHEGMRRMRERGLRVATVFTASVNAPAQALYVSSGFGIVGLEHFYRKQF